MASLRDYQPLRLMAADQDDLKMVSSCLQDAIAKLGDFAFLPDQKRFAFVANRFIWEAAGKRGPFGRVRAGIHFDDVSRVSRQNLRDSAGEAVIELLSIRFEEGDDGAGSFFLDFSGGGAIRLDVESINIQISDISEPWRTKSKPKHDV